MTRLTTYGVFYYRMSQPTKSQQWTYTPTTPATSKSPASLPATRSTFAPDTDRFAPTNTPDAKTPSTPMDLAYAQASLDLDEKEIEALIAAMGNSDFQIREQASQKLKLLGPEGVPALQKYRDHIDPEIAGRVNALIQNFEWMKQGAIVLSTETYHTQVAELGIKPGDVIVKVNDVPVVGRSTIEQTAPDQERTLSIWRAGRIVSIKVGPGTIGVRLANWDLAKGGNDHARGVSLFERPGKPDTIEAYRRLRRAREAGMDDRATIGLLGCIAAQLLDHDYAMQCYRTFRGNDSGCGLTHDDAGELFHELPFNSPHSAYLLERFRAEAWTPFLYHELEDWFSRHGRNYPMLKQTLGKPWGPEAIDPDFRRFDAAARLKFDITERHWSDALRDYGHDPIDLFSFDSRHDCAMMAAIRSGRIDKAVEIADHVLDICKEVPDYRAYIGASVWHALEAVAAAGDAPAAKKLAARIQALSDDDKDRIIGTSVRAMTLDVGAAEYTLPILAELAHLPRNNPLQYAYFSLLSSAPKTTQEEFEKAWAHRKEGDPAEFSIAVKAFLRFGDYDKARAAWEQHLKFNKSSQAPDQRARAISALDFAAANAQRLANDWSALRGMIQVLDGTEKNTHWVLKWDGAVLFVDAAGKIHDYPGLPRSPVPLFLASNYLNVGPKSVSIQSVYQEGISNIDAHYQVAPYILDTAAGKWMNAYQSDVEIDPQSTGNLAETLRATIIRYVNKTYPLPSGEMPRTYIEHNIGDLTFEGNIRVRCNRADFSITDLSAEIAAAAKLSRPAEIYDTGMDSASHMNLILTDVGLFEQDRSTFKRVELPLIKNQNVHLTWMNSRPYQGVNYGGKLLGVAPQDGGQVFILEKDGLHPTNGYCGLGPQDWFASQFNRVTPVRLLMDQPIHQLNEKRKPQAN